MDIAFTSTHLNAISDRAIDVKAGTTVGNVLDEIISLAGVQSISVVDGSGNAVALTEVITTDHSLKVVSADGTKTNVVPFSIDGPVTSSTDVDRAALHEVA